MQLILGTHMGLTYAISTLNWIFREFLLENIFACLTWFLIIDVPQK